LKIFEKRAESLNIRKKTTYLLPTRTSQKSLDCSEESLDH